MVYHPWQLPTRCQTTTVHFANHLKCSKRNLENLCLGLTWDAYDFAKPITTHIVKEHKWPQTKMYTVSYNYFSFTRKTDINSRTANASIHIVFKGNTPKKMDHTMLKSMNNHARSCVHFYLMPLMPLKRCDQSKAGNHSSCQDDKYRALKCEHWWLKFSL